MRFFVPKLLLSALYCRCSWIHLFARLTQMELGTSSSRFVSLRSLVENVINFITISSPTSPGRYVFLRVHNWPR